jgi:PAS domain S-box-containing protein
MINELQKLRELTDTLTGNGYLKDRADEWEDILDAIPNFVYITDTDFRIKFVNNALVNKLKVFKGDILDKLCYNVVRSLENQAKDFNNAEDTLIISREHIEKLDGWFKIVRAPIKNRNNKLLGFVYVLQDFTLEKETIEDLKKKEKLFDTVFEYAPIGIGLVDSETNVFYAVNRYLTDLLGYKKEELIGRSSKMIYPNEEEFLRVGIIACSDINNRCKPLTNAKLETKKGEEIEVCIKTNLSIEGTFVLIVSSRDKEENAFCNIDLKCLSNVHKNTNS